MGPNAAPAPFRGRPRDEHTDEAILATTLRLLRSIGYRSVSVEAVAADAGVAKTTVYRRYRNKADLATAALAKVADAGGLPAPSDDPRRDLVAHLRDFETKMGTVGLGVIGSLLAEGDPEFLELHRQRIIQPRHQRARQLLRRAQELGHIREDADLDLVMELLIGSFIAGHLAGRGTPPGWAESAVTIVWEGLQTGRQGRA